MRSYKENLFVRYEKLTQQIETFEGSNNLLLIRIFRMHGEILQEYGSIIEKDDENIQEINNMTPSEEEAMKKFEKAKAIIRDRKN